MQVFVLVFTAKEFILISLTNLHFISLCLLVNSWVLFCNFQFINFLIVAWKSSINKIDSIFLIYATKRTSMAILIRSACLANFTWKHKYKGPWILPYGVYRFIENPFPSKTKLNPCPRFHLNNWFLIFSYTGPPYMIEDYFSGLPVKFIRSLHWAYGFPNLKMIPQPWKLRHSPGGCRTLDLVQNKANHGLRLFFYIKMIS